MNIFNNPEIFRRAILRTPGLVERKMAFPGKSLICVFFTAYCNIGCPFCFFQSPPQENHSREYDIENRFLPEGVEHFIIPTNDKICRRGYTTTALSAIMREKGVGNDDR